MSEHDVAERLSGVAAELAGVAKALDALTEKVGQQNGRISVIEADCASYQSMSVTRAQTEIRVDNKLDSIETRTGDRLDSMEARTTDRLDSMEGRMRKIESSQDQGRGNKRARSEMLRDAVMILTLLSTATMAGYQMFFSHPAPVPAAQHQVK